MKRTTILADEAILTELEYLARADGVPTSRLIREALERYVAERTAARARRLPSFVGMLRSGDPTLAERDEEILAAELPEALAGELSGGVPDRVSGKRRSGRTGRTA